MLLTVNGICLLCQLNGALGKGWKHPLDISIAMNGMIMELLPHVGTHEEAQDKKLTCLALSVICKPKSRKLTVNGICLF